MDLLIFYLKIRNIKLHNIYDTNFTIKVIVSNVMHK